MYKRQIYIHMPVTANSHEPQVASSSPRHKKPTKAGAATQAQVVHHKVKQGETLFSIANSYKTTVSALERDNGKLATLRPGMVLIIHDTR